MGVDLTKMSEDEKDAFIATYETILDCDDGYLLSNEDIELYNQLIAERSQKAPLDDVILSAEQKRDEQDDRPAELIEHKMR